MANENKGTTANIMNTYTTLEGLKLLTDWAGGNHSATIYEQNRVKAFQAVGKLFDCVRIVWGDKPKTRGQMALRMPYTSSSAFAAIWAGVDFGAVDKENSNKHLKGVAITDAGEAVAFWKLCDDNGNELKDIFEVIR